MASQFGNRYLHKRRSASLERQRQRETSAQGGPSIDFGEVPAESIPREWRKRRGGQFPDGYSGHDDNR